LQGFNFTVITTTITPLTEEGGEEWLPKAWKPWCFRYLRLCQSRCSAALTEATYIWRVVDHTKQQVLAIEARNIASVAPDDTELQLQINAVNDTCIGKFSIVDQDRLDYCLELPYTQESTPALFQHALFLALDTVAAHYESWQEAARVSLLGKDLNEAGLFDRIKEAFG
jgi:hypothetical protein